MVKDGIPDFRVRPPGHGGHPLQACPVPGPPGSKMHALCPSHRQTGDSRGDSRLSMSVTLTSDHSKIFFAAVTAAFAAPPPGRTATAAPHWPLQCRCSGCTAARSRRTATAAQRHCRRRVDGDSSATRRHRASRVSVCHAVWHGQARRVPPRQHCRCTQAATACQCRRACAAAPLHCRRTASARVRRVRTESALTPQCRRCRVTPCAAAPHCRVCRRCRRTAAHWSRDSTSMSSHCRPCRVVCRQCRHCRAAD